MLNAAEITRRAATGRSTASMNETAWTSIHAKNTSRLNSKEFNHPSILASV